MKTTSDYPGIEKFMSMQGEAQIAQLDFKKLASAVAPSTFLKPQLAQAVMFLKKKEG